MTPRSDGHAVASWVSRSLKSDLLSSIVTISNVLTKRRATFTRSARARPMVEQYRFIRCAQSENSQRLFHSAAHSHVLFLKYTKQPGTRFHLDIF